MDPYSTKLGSLAKQTPWLLVAIACALVVTGFFSIARSEELLDRSSHLVRHQIVWSILGALAMIVILVPSYRVICRVSYLLFAICLGLLVVVYFFPPINGSRRWIRLLGIGFQPSEFAKILYVLMLARYLRYRENYRRLWGLVIPLAISLVPMLLILREPDLGTALVFLPVLVGMLFIAGARSRDLCILCGLGLLILPLLWSQMNREQRSRVTALLQQSAPDQSASADGYHLHQAKRMFAAGGFTGSYFQGERIVDRTAYLVPEAATDSILTVIAERFGLLGTAAVLFLYVGLIWQALRIAQRTREPFARLVAAGIAVLFAAEVAINTSMLVGLLPITGLSLPLISYGGSGLVAHLCGIGLLLNIGARRDYEVTEEPFRYAAT